MSYPVYDLLRLDAGVIAIVGTRIYAAGAMPPETAMPALTYQVITGQPENYLDGVPTIERQRVQVDAWAAGLAAAEQLQSAARVAVIAGGRNVCISNNGHDYEPETKRYRASRDYEVWVDL